MKGLRDSGAALHGYEMAKALVVGLASDTKESVSWQLRAIAKR